MHVEKSGGRDAILMTYRLNYRGFIVLVLCAGGLIAVIHSGSNNSTVTSNAFASGVGTAAAALLFGRAGCWFTRNKMRGHLIGTLIAAPLGIYASELTEMMREAQHPRSGQEILAAKQAVALEGRQVDAAALQASMAGATCMAPETGNDLGNTNDTSADLSQLIADEYSRAAALQNISPEEVRAYHLAADRGEAEALYGLGELYAAGAGVLKDPIEAERLFVLAAQQGNPAHQSQLADKYRYGGEIGQDLAAAVQWYETSAKQGYSPSQAALAYIYADEAQASADNVLAHMWSNIADACGFTAMGDFRDNLASGMSDSQIAEATQRARQCLASSFAQCG